MRRRRGTYTACALHGYVKDFAALALTYIVVSYVFRNSFVSIVLGGPSYS